MEADAQRTLYIGLIGAFVVYALGTVLSNLIEGDFGYWVGNVLILGALAFVLVWLLMVKRGFRLGAFKKSRATRRRKERQKTR